LFIKAARKAVEEDGAEVIVPGCGYFSELAEEVQKDVDVPVLDNVGVALKMAELLAYLGLTHHRINSEEIERRTCARACGVSQ
jgi:Asp/Glu/hydantoin racemase